MTNSRNKGAQFERRELDWLPNYDISSDGIVRRNSAPRKGPGRNKETPYRLSVFARSGYPSVRVCLPDGTPKSFTVHRLVCEAFNGPPPKGHVVAHNDGNPENCHASNLRWATQKDNHADKIEHGTHLVGSAIGNSKITEGDALRIRKMRAEGLSLKHIAEHFGLTIAATHCVCSGKTWAHVGGVHG